MLECSVCRYWKPDEELEQRQENRKARPFTGVCRCEKWRFSDSDGASTSATSATDFSLVTEADFVCRHFAYDESRRRDVVCMRCQSRETVREGFFIVDGEYVCWKCKRADDQYQFSGIMSSAIEVGGTTSMRE